MASDKKKEEKIREEKIRTEIEADSSGGLDNWAIRQTYLNTKDLVRSTDKLKCWTKVIAVLTFIMICTTIFYIAVYIIGACK